VRSPLPWWQVPMAPCAGGLTWRCVGRVRFGGPAEEGCDRGMEFRILGPLEVHDGAAPVPIPGAKERALLADLLVHAGRVVSADRLIDDVWGDRAPGSPANTLQGRVSALRRALGPAAALLATRPPGYRLEVDPEQVDAARFERLLAEAGRAAAQGPPPRGPAAGGGAGAVAGAGARRVRRPAVRAGRGAPPGGAAAGRHRAAGRAGAGRGPPRRAGGGAGSARRRPSAS
jgi:DNA-binding winged helix-turn-helix (wHTH) protein